LRDAVFIAAMLALLPLAAARPFVGVLLWSWISFMNPHRMVYGTASAMPLAAAVFCVTVLGCVLAREPRRLTLNGVTVLMLVLMGCFTVTTLTALGPAPAVWQRYELIQKMLLGLLLTASLLNDRWRVHALLWVMVMSLGYFGLKGGVFALLTGGEHRVFGPMQTMIEDNNHLAAGLLVTLPLMNYLRLHSRHRAVRLALVAVMVLTLLATVASYSRGALLGLTAATLVLWLRSRRKLTSGIVLAACVAGAIAFMPERWTQRMETLNTYEADSSATDRLVMWSTALKLALDRPLVGSGFAGPYTRAVVDRVDEYSPARAVHSIWFEVIGEHGFPTFAVWLGLTVAGVFYSVRLLRLTRGRPDLAWAQDLGRMAQVSIVAYLVSGTFLSLSYWDYYWTLLVVLGATYALAARAVRGEVNAEAPAWQRTHFASPRHPAPGAAAP